MWGFIFEGGFLVGEWWARGRGRGSLEVVANPQMESAFPCFQVLALPVIFKDEDEDEDEDIC